MLISLSRIRRWDYVRDLNNSTTVVQSSWRMSDRDSSRWGLDDEVSQRRHATFWQLYRMELMAVSVSFYFSKVKVCDRRMPQSLHLGRPPLLSEVFIDCPLPRDYFLARSIRNPPQEPSCQSKSFFMIFVIAELRPQKITFGQSNSSDLRVTSLKKLSASSHILTLQSWP